MRKVFLDELPRKGKRIDWISCIGKTISFIYDDIEDNVEILDYIKDKSKIIIYNNKYGEFEIFTGHLGDCKLGKYLNKITKEFKICLNESIQDEKRDLTITNREYRVDKSGITRKWYKYTCNVCGWTDGWIEESGIISGCGCSCCAGQVVVPHINSIKAKAPWMIGLGVSDGDAVKYSWGSGKKIKVTCPDCGNKKFIQIDNIYYYKSICCTCNDNTSYPEKFVASVLSQLNVKFISQISSSDFEWCGRVRYDFYVPKIDLIIEVHGIQHYEYSGFNRTIKEEQDNDAYKEKLSRDNGISNYVVIDCRKSKIDFIKNSIINSELNELFDLSKINWSDCEKYALSNIVKSVCEYWNNKECDETTSCLGVKFNLNENTIRRYLKKGTKIGWCKYNPKEELRKSVSKNGANSGKITEIFKDEISLGVFNSTYELERSSVNLFGTLLTQQGISKVCNGKLKQYKGYTFKYVENEEVA